jgi:protocatechuate 3,4-dioxygenase beta subunit
VYVFSDTAGNFSYYINRSLANSISVSQPIDVLGVSNGYIPPGEQTKSILSDTTTVSVVFSLATSFVEGYVRDQTGAPILGANVYANGNGFSTRTRTDTNGYYKVGVSAGTCYLEAGPPASSDYLTAYPTYQLLTVPASATVQRDMRLVHSNSTITGKVTLDGQGVAGVPIWASSDSLSNFVISTGDGTYAMPVYKSPAATLLYTVSAYVENGFYISVPNRSNMLPGAFGVDFTIVRIAGGIQGRITDQNTGMPIANADVRASGNSYKSTVSNDSGYYRMSLPDGAYSLTIEAARYYEYYDWNVSVSGSMITRNVSLQKSGSISGTAQDKDGNPIPNASIYASSSDTLGYYSAYGYSDAEGKYVLSGLRTSRYKVQCSKYGYMTIWYDNVPDWQTAALVQVTDGFDTPNINFTLSRGGSLSGKATDKSGKATASVEIDVYDTTYSMRSYAMTNDSGYYVVSGLPSGKYFVAAYSSMYFGQWYDGADSYLKATPVSVTIEENTPNINFTLSAGSSFSGKVTTKAGTPIPNASIYVAAQSDTMFEIVGYASTNDSGFYMISRLKPGSTHYVYASAYGYSIRWYNNVASFNAATAIVLQDEETKSNVDFTLPVAASISGRIRDNAGHPILYAYINVLDSLGSYAGYGYPDTSGVYKVTNLSSGIHYYVYASAYGYSIRWYNNAASFNAATAIVLQDEEARTNIDFTLPPAGSISGWIRDGAGHPLLNAYVNVVDSMGSYVGYAYPDSQGTYRVANLSGGSYFATAYAYEYDQQWFDHKSSQQQADKIAVVDEKTTENINFTFIPPSTDTIVIRLSLAHIPDTLVFSRTGLPDYYVDYHWGVRMDIDGNRSTGPQGANGCEIELVAFHYKVPGEQEYKSTLVGGTFHVLIEWIGDVAYWRHTDVDIALDKNDRNTLVIRAPKRWPELSALTSSTKYYIHTFSQLDGKVGSDNTLLSSGFVPTTDPSGDVDIDYIDVLNVTPSIVASTVTSLDDFAQNTIPSSFYLKQNYPNPFNPSTKIMYGLPQDSRVSLKVYSILGQEVNTLVNDVQKASSYNTTWNGRDKNGMQVSSGVYFFRLFAQPMDGKGRPFVQVKKMLLMK